MKKVALLMLLGAAVGCSSPTPPSTPNPLESTGTTTVGKLPTRVQEHYTMNYEIQHDAPEDAMGGYRFGDEGTVLHVFTTPQGLVFVDDAGGGYATAESCASLTIFVERNSWTNGHGCP